LTFWDETHKRTVGLARGNNGGTFRDVGEDGVNDTQAGQTFMCVGEQSFCSWVRIEKLIERLYGY
jgi:hypothetical protein